ncbi:hypothetical protein COP1_040994 [Malus domestica]
MVKIGTTLLPPIQLALIFFLQENTEVFAWSYEDMSGISPNIICHRLSIDPKTKPVRQKRRSYDAERYEAMKAEVEKLKGIGFLREVNYPTWVANVVLVKKNPTKESLLLQKVLWRMCIDYTNLNKGCSNDSFPLPLIYRLIDSTAGCELLSFMDAYLGYNQILMNPPDQEHITFTTDRGLYCYKIGKSMEVYVDDMLVKSKDADQHITNLSETFTILKRFISKATYRCDPFFKALKGSKKYITWTDEWAKAFKNLKDYMSKAHLFSKPEDGNVERPVYYASKALQDAESRYSNIEKLALALGYGAGLVLTTSDKVAMEYAICFKFKASNNEAEYEALIAGLRLAKHLGVKRIDIFSDSQLVVNQVTNNFNAKDSSMAAYLAQTQLLLKHFHYQIT